MKQLNLAMVWHMHQPLYKDNLSGKYLMPWVRLHAIKDYLDMALLMEDFPRLKQTFNLVPSLIEQLEDYAYNNVSDPYLDLSRIEVEKLTNSDKSRILELFFDLNWEKMIYKFPRYNEILRKREKLKKKYNSDFSKIAKDFQNQELLDLTVWFNIAWFDYIWQTQDTTLVKIIKKGKNFTYQDREDVIQKQFEIIRKIIPEYKKLQEEGHIEITTTPYYHPILPLLYNSNSARISRPDSPLPENTYSYPDDVNIQIKRAVEKYEKLFGKKPLGFWPSEQSVSQEIISCFHENKVNWIISDEGILFHSIGQFPHRNNIDIFDDPTILYKPYWVGEGDKKVAMIFRDIVLSDAIGFVYSRMEPTNAAYTLYSKLKEIQKKLPDDYPYIVTIALDGENCWEHYENDGYNFLTSFYKLVQEDETINMTSVSDYLEKYPPQKEIPHLFSGSWIRSDFTTWIGDETKNKAWDCLYLAREELVKFEKSNPDSNVLSKAWEEIYIAEGSDWFWWFGEGNTSTHDDMFDWQFRLHLQNVYKLIGLPIPEYLKDSLYKDLEGIRNMMNNMYDFSHSTGTMQRAVKTFEKLYFKNDDKYFYLKFELSDNYYNNDIEVFFNSHDKDTPTIYAFEQTVINSDYKANLGVVIKGDITKSKDKKFSLYKVQDGIWSKFDVSSDIEAKGSTIEIKIPYSLFNTNDNYFSFIVVSYEEDKIEEVSDQIDYYIV